ncbi:MAG: helix-turn-helix transcriptional regulator [Deltaproteobacteria bacterium]|nr:helix-turn-helix transcriptional regulator [Deltaproteobacteria bacterium]
MKIKFENAEKHLKEKLKNPKFKETYELERVKVALAQKIAETRDEHNLSQSELAKRMNVSQQFISQVESGEGNLTLETLSKLAQSLNTSIRISFSKKPCRNGCLKVA